MSYSAHKIWSLAWPLILSNISVPLLGLIDTAMLGHLASSHYLSAVAMGASLIAFVFSGMNFLRMSTTGFSAQALGARNQTLALAVLVQSAKLALLLGVLIILLSPVFIALCLAIVQPDEDLRQLIQSYMQIRLLSSPAALLSMAVIGWAIGQQQTSIALVALSLTNGLNILFDYCFIMVWQLNSNGAAWASVLAEYLGLAGTLWLARKQFPTLKQPPFSLWQLPKHLPWRRFLSINRDILIRTLSLLWVFAFFYAQGENISPTVLAANAMLIQLLLFQAYALDGFANVAEALVGEARGEQSRQAMDMALLQTGAASLICSVILVLIFLLLQPFMIGWLTDIDALHNAANAFILWICLMPLLSHWSYWLDGVAVGLAASTAMRNSMLAAALLVFLPVWFFSQPLGNTGLWLAFFAFTLARAVFLSPLLISARFRYRFENV